MRKPRAFVPFITSSTLKLCNAVSQIDLDEVKKICESLLCITSAKESFVELTSRAAGSQLCVVNDHFYEKINKVFLMRMHNVSFHREIRLASVSKD